ncbi:DUF3905 domain-containing protein [Paenibacillus arenilitoris]|uniref:DUF3905 domain-containing protein n=1 Tax=Paenibacillus arenilitoris TaxID=2772299 RepID=A0A927H502_9BACL|nr:DUF3905 domain-containing protein [Paenibacillus arenilitoris]MBD2867917.1 DUF3905 domain-containing protein [Paenibacillus arenilitoris]
MADDGRKEAAELPKDDPALDPYEIEFLPQFREGRGGRAPFVNKHGVVIGDHEYESAQSPLSQWSTETDPAVMAGDEWVHPFKDVGFLTAENRAVFEEGRPPKGGIFMHPYKNTAYRAEEPDNEPDSAEKEQPE